jgi:hypothetical protein
MRSEAVPKDLPPKSRSRSTSFRDKTSRSGLQRIVIDENSVHESPVDPIAPRLPSAGAPPPINPPSKHRHSRSLPALRAEANLPSSTPPVRERARKPPQSPTKALRHSQSMNGIDFPKLLKVYLDLYRSCEPGTFVPRRVYTGNQIQHSA